MLRSRNFLSAVIGMAMAGAMLDLGRAVPSQGPRERKPQRRTFAAISSSTFPSNGARECARRRRQIAAGILTRSNGVVPEAFA